MRDLGGFPTLNNLETKYNVFIRSNIVTNLLESEIKYLLNNNILTIIDLRDEDEILKKHSFFENDKRFRYYNVTLKGKEAPKVEKNIPLIYMKIIDDKEKIKEVFQIILKSQNGVLIHCNSGKDRTGIIAMLLLMIAGVDNLDIVADYSVSDIYLKDSMKKFHEENPKLPKFLGSSKSWYMEKTLELFYKKYKTINNYMNYLGFSNEEINKIKNKFVNSI